LFSHLQKLVQADWNNTKIMYYLCNINTFLKKIYFLTISFQNFLKPFRHVFNSRSYQSNKAKNQQSSTDCFLTQVWCEGQLKTRLYAMSNNKIITYSLYMYIQSRGSKPDQNFPHYLCRMASPGAFSSETLGALCGSLFLRFHRLVVPGLEQR